MRDIRRDLVERLDALSRQREELTRRLDELVNERSALQALLDAENRRFGDVSDANADEQTAAQFNMGIQEFTLGCLRLGGTWNVAGLKKRAQDQKLDFGDGLIGRRIQGALMGLAQQGLVESIGGGNWRIRKEEALSEDSSESASKITGEGDASPFDSREGKGLLD